MFQSTLPQGERPPGPVARGFFTQVSIHAPAGGATDAAAGAFNYLGFNPRSRRGSDFLAARG